MSKAVTVLAITALCSFIAILCIFPIEDPDIWHHLAYGRWIVQHQGHTSAVSPFVWSVDKVGETNFEWLTEVAVYGVWKEGGLAAISVVKAVLIVAIFLLLIVTVTRLGVPLVLSLPLITLGVLASAERFMERLEHVGYFFLVFLLTMVYVVQKRNQHKDRSLWILPVVMVLWINMHGSFTLGLIILGLSTVIAYWSRWHLRRTLLVITLVSCVGLAIHPNRTEALKATFEFLPGFTKTNALLLSQVYEFQSPFSPFHRSEIYVLIYKILLFLYWGGFLVGVYRGKSSWLGLACLSAGTVLSFSAARQINVFVLLGFLPALEGWFDVSSKKERVLSAPANRSMAALLLMIVALGGAGWYVVRYGYHLGTTRRHFGIGVRPIVPDRAVAFLNSEQIGGKLLNQYEIGSYMAWCCGTQRQVFIDGFASYPEWFFKQYLAMSESPQKMDQVLDDYHIDYVLTLYPESQSGKSVPDYLSQSPQWVLVYWDNYYLIFVRRQDQFSNVIARDAYQYADPLKLSRPSFVKRLQGSEGPILQTKIIEELNRNLMLNPTNSRGYLLRGSMQEGIGDPTGALKLYAQAKRYDHDTILPYLVTAQILMKADHWDDAKKELLAGVAQNSSAPGAYVLLGQIEEKNKRYSQAQAYYQQAIALQPDMALAYFRIGAVSFLSGGSRTKVRLYINHALELGLDDASADQARALLQQL